MSLSTKGNKTMVQVFTVCYKTEDNIEMILSFHATRGEALHVAKSLTDALDESLEPLVYSELLVGQSQAMEYDNRVPPDDDAMYVPPDLDTIFWEEVTIREFRTSRSGEPYFCLYTGFALKGTDEILYYINPPRRGRVDVTYGTPSHYQIIKGV